MLHGVVLLNSARAGWRRLMGPVDRTTGASVLLIATTAGLAVGCRSARRRGPLIGAALGAVTVDIVGGLLSFQVPAVRRKYAEHGRLERLVFPLVHVQPYLFPIVAEGSWTVAACRHLSALGCSVALETVPLRPGVRRPAACALAVLLAAGDLLLADSGPHRWFGPAYLLKVIGGHGSLEHPARPAGPAGSRRRRRGRRRG